MKGINQFMEQKKAGFRLKLSTKKLQSGKCQVKFHATSPQKKSFYGYVLADAKTTLKEVVENIEKRLDSSQRQDSFHHWNLYQIGKPKTDNLSIFIFDE